MKPELNIIIETLKGPRSITEIINDFNFQELDAIPKALILELSAKIIGPYACFLRAERNNYKSIAEQALKNLEITRHQLKKSEESFKNLKKDEAKNGR